MGGDASEELGAEIKDLWELPKIDQLVDKLTGSGLRSPPRRRRQKGRTQADLPRQIRR